MVKEKKYEEALAAIPVSTDVHSVLMRAQLYLNLKQQSACISELITYIKSSDSARGLIPLVFRLANNYKLLDKPEFTEFVKSMVNQQMQTGQIDI